MALFVVLVSLATSGCTTRSGGRALAQVLFGVVSLAAHAVTLAGSASGRGHEASEAEPARLQTLCTLKRDEWFEVYQGSGEELPPHLRCKPDGDWPDSSMAVVTTPAPAPAEAREPGPEPRTAGSRAECGESETERQRCEGLRAVQEQRRRGGQRTLQW